MTSPEHTLPLLSAATYTALSGKQKTATPTASVPTNEEQTLGTSSAQAPVRLTDSEPSVQDIYFTPRVVTGSKVELGSPLPVLPAPLSPAETPTPTQQTFDRAVAVERTARPAEREAETVLKLTHEHLQRLAKAFVEAPVMKGRLCKPFKDASKEEKTAGQPMKVRLRGIAITDIKTPGASIRFATAGYRESPNVLNVRGQSFLNAPYGGDKQHDCCMHIEWSGHGGDETCKVLICMISEVLDRWTGTIIYKLVAEVDITDVVTSVLLAELAQIAAKIDMSDVKLEFASTTDTTTAQSSADDIDAIDWCAVADELQATEDLDTFVDTASAVFGLLDETSVTLQTLALLDDLERLKRKHNDFVIVTAKPHPTNPKSAPARAGVPWISEHLEAKIHAEMELHEPERRAFRAKVVEAVAKKAVEREPFFITVPVASKDAKLFCAPLESVDRWATEEVWICFVLDTVTVERSQAAVVE